MAIMSIVLAPFVGRLTDRVHPRIITGIGFAALLASLVWLIARDGARHLHWRWSPR